MKNYLIVLLVSLGLQTQAQLTMCDSLSYSIFPNTTLTVTPSSGGLSNQVGAIDWSFTACNDVACYVGQGTNPYSFPLIQMSDTVKLCYDAFIYALDSTVTVCNYCDSLVYDWNQFTWIVIPRNTSTFVIEEDGVRWYSDNKTYNLMGKEIQQAPIGTIFIRNNKKQMRVE
tara:strand:+ start:554 stop:1066 length:513 start_codon:yes stop_codon:yes gene_type:complete